MPVISAKNFNTIAFWLSTKIANENLDMNQLLPLLNDYDMFVAETKDLKLPSRSRAVAKTDAITEEDKIVEAVTNVVTTKKKGGRKPKVVDTESEVDDTKVVDTEPKVVDTEPKVVDTESEVVDTKKKRGRKPNATIVVSAVSDVSDVSVASTTKKKGGRKANATNVLTEPEPITRSQFESVNEVSVNEVSVNEVIEPAQKKKGGKKSKATTIVVSEPLEPELLQILDKVLDTPEEDDEELEVDAITYDGVDYLLDTNTNEVYNMDSELVGKMNGNELILF